MRGKIKKGIAFILSTVFGVATCITTIPQLSVPVYAAGAGKNLQFGHAAIGEGVNNINGPAATVYFGSQDDPLAWRVIGYNGSGVESSTNTATLLASNNISKSKFDELSPYSHVYSNSTLQNAVYNIYTNRFTSIEDSNILPRTLQIGDYSDTAPYTDGVKTTQVTGAKLWPLSTQEAYYTNSDLRKASDYWWLRSPGSDYDLAAFVYNSGGVNFGGLYVQADKFGVRPAFNLNLSSIIFTSAAESGKNPTTAGTLEAPGDYAGTEWKLTLHDSKMVIAEGAAGVSRDESAITVPYTVSGDHAGNVNRISVLITDKAYTAADAAIKYYGNLAITGSIRTSGTGTFTLPDDFDTDWKVYILSENITDVKKSDYASTPVEIAIPAASKPTLTITAKDKTFPYNGQMQGPGGAEYTDPDEIAGMVTVEGLQPGDALSSIIVKGKGQEVGDYDLTPFAATINNNVSASDKYDVTYVNGKLHITSTGKSYTVTFKVENGAWNDGTKADRTVTLSGGAGDTLKLSADQIPAVGSKPDTRYKEGSWDVTPDTKTAITSDTTYIYTYANDGPQPDKCTITFKPNGGKGEMKPQTADKGETVKLKANDFTRSGYSFKNWNTEADGSGDKFENKQSVKLEKDLTLYAQWKEKHHDDDDDDDDHEDEPSQPNKNVKYPDGFDELRGLLNNAASAAKTTGLNQTVSWNKGTSLPADVMKTLHDNPNVTLVFSCTYQGVPITLTIPGSAVVLDPAVQWYGPLYLYPLYGNAKAPASVQNTTAATGTYTVKSGDSLKRIATKLNTSVKHLQDVNNIKDPDKIKVGMVLKY